MTGAGSAVARPSASLGPGSSIQIAHPAIAMAGKTSSRACAAPNDHPAIIMAKPSSGGDGAIGRTPAQENSPAGVTPYGFSHDCRCTVPPLAQ
jgi:hypothetical protein